MYNRFYSTVVAAALFLPVAVFAQEKKLPTVVVRVRSIDEVVKSIKVLSKVVDKSNVGDFLSTQLKKQTGPNGLAGIDPERPFGVYVVWGLSRLPHIADSLLMRWQLKNAPDVRQLWP